MENQIREFKYRDFNMYAKKDYDTDRKKFIYTLQVLNPDSGNTSELVIAFNTIEQRDTAFNNLSAQKLSNIASGLFQNTLSLNQ